MRRALLVSLVLAAATSGWQPAAEACGDKFLLVGRGAKFGRAYAAIYPGNILIFARPATSPKAAIRDPQFHKILRQAGHAVSVIEDATLLEQALRTVAVDVVLADLTEAPTIDRLAATSPSHPSVLPVAFKTDSEQIKKLQQQYACDLKASDRPLRFLEKIESTMKQRVSARRGQKS